MVSGGLPLQLLHAGLLLAVAPLAAGLTRWLRARLDGRHGPPLLQPYRDLHRAVRRRPVLAESASPFAAGVPLVAVAALALAAGLLPPVFFPGVAPAAAAGAPFASPPAISGDLVLIAALLGVSRFAFALAHLDAGTAAGGLGAARLVARPVLFEPALLLVALCVATVAGAEASAGAAGASGGVPFGGWAPLLPAAGTVLLVGAADTPQPPVAGATAGDLPHDLGDAPEAIGAEFSGWHLALWDYGRALRGTLFLALLATLLPPPPALAGAAGVVFGPLFGLAELALLCAALAAAENTLAPLRPGLLPVAGAGALVLAVLAAALLLLGNVAT